MAQLAFSIIQTATEASLGWTSSFIERRQENERPLPCNIAAPLAGFIKIVPNQPHHPLKTAKDFCFWIFC